MSNIINIEDFKGCWTNADKEDISKEHFITLKNLRPNNGKLEKTFGFGDKITTALSVSANNIFTYIHPNLTGGKLYVAVYVNPTTFVVTVYAWSGTAWVEISTLSNFFNPDSLTFYHKADTNPIVQDGEYLRILPGNVGAADGTNESKGIWIGYIDYKLFDEIYSLTAGFYIYATDIAKPDLTITTEQLTGEASAIFFTAGAKYYKFSYVYDGINESLLSEAKGLVYAANEWGKFSFSITKASHNKRITALKVYRSDSHSEIDETNLYNLIHTIEFLRDSGTAKSGDTCYYSRAFYIPSLTTYNFNNAKVYKLDWYQLVGGTTIITDVDEAALSGTGHTVFTIKEGETGDPQTVWNGWWELLEDDVTVAGGSSDAGDYEGSLGAYGGNKVCIVNTDLGTNNLTGGVLYYNKDLSAPLIRCISANFGKAIRFYGDILEDTGGSSTIKYTWKALSPEGGLYTITENGNDVDIVFFDPNLPKGAKHPLLGEVSTKVNGKFARVIGERLWQLDTVLQPEDKKEVRKSWATYSELSQLDVNAVGNAKPVTDREGGVGAGIADMLGNVVVLMEYGITTFGTRDYPGTPASWAEIESSHNIGNIADKGYITVMGSLYITYWDGIYRLRPNNLAESDRTPTKQLRISEPINDTFLALSDTQKQAVKVEFDQYKSELIFVLGDEIWAFNISKEEWRMIESNVTVSIMTKDEVANVIVYDESTKKIYSSGENEATDIELKLKDFLISDDESQKEVIEYIWVTYKSATALTINVYLENYTDVKGTFTLPANSRIKTHKIGIHYRASKFTIAIVDSVESTTDTEIGKIKIQTS